MIPSDYLFSPDGMITIHVDKPFIRWQVYWIDRQGVDHVRYFWRHEKAVDFAMEVTYT